MVFFVNLFPSISFLNLSLSLFLCCVRGLFFHFFSLIWKWTHQPDQRVAAPCGHASDIFAMRERVVAQADLAELRRVLGDVIRLRQGAVHRLVGGIRVEGAGPRRHREPSAADAVD